MSAGVSANGMSAIGVLVPPDLAPARFIEFVRLTERLGFDELWVPEDCFFSGAIAQAAVALASSGRLRVGIGVLPAAARAVSFAALEITFLAQQFPGRLTVGVGHGMRGWLEQAGLQPASPLTLLREYLDALRALLAGQQLDVAGRYVQLRGVRLAHPPDLAPQVLAGVRGPKSLALSGLHADGTILAEPVTPAYLSLARSSIAAVGHHELVVYNVAAVDIDAGRARERVRGALRITGDPAWAPHIAPLPFAAELARLRTSTTSLDDFAARLPDAWIDSLALVGDLPRVRRQLADLVDAGADHLVLNPVGPDPFDGVTGLAALL